MSSKLTTCPLGNWLGEFGDGSWVLKGCSMRSFGYRTKGVTPWDYGDIQPPLKEAIEKSGIEFAKSGRALVPGCGSVRPIFSALYDKSLKPAGV